MESTTFTRRRENRTNAILGDRKRLTLLKYTLTVINVLFMGIAVALIVVSVKLNNELVGDFEPIVQTPIYAPLSAMFIAGVIFIVALVGIIGLKVESATILVSYCTFIGVVAVSEAMIVYVFYKQFYSEFEPRLVMNFEQHLIDSPNNTSSRIFIDQLQRQLECCGSNNTNIWLDINNNAYPDSCYPPLVKQKFMAIDQIDANNNNTKIHHIIFNDPIVINNNDNNNNSNIDDGIDVYDYEIVGDKVGVHLRSLLSMKSSMERPLYQDRCVAKIMNVIWTWTRMMSWTLMALVALELVALVCASIVRRKFNIKQKAKKRAFNEIPFTRTGEHIRMIR